MENTWRRERTGIVSWERGQVSYLFDFPTILLCLLILNSIPMQQERRGEGRVRESSVWFGKVSVRVLNWEVPLLNHDTWAEHEEVCFEVLPTSPCFC